MNHDPGTPGTGPLPDPDGHDDLSPTAAALRDALAARADATHPTDRLQEIRMSTTRTARRTTRARVAVASAAAAVVVVGGGALALNGGGGDDVRTVASAPTSSAAPQRTVPPAAEPAATASPSASAPGTAAASPRTPSAAPTSPRASATRTAPAPAAAAPALPSGASSVPVYWLGDGGTKLYREWLRPRAGGADDATAALRTMLAGDPADPDYTSPWSADPTAEVTAEDGRYVVDVSAAAAGGGAPGALAVQQLVHTVTAAAGENAPVVLRVAGRAAQTVSRAPQAEVQAPVWITSATARSGGIAVEGVGTAFEGTLLYVVTAADGTEVARDSVQAGANGTFAEFSFTVDVPAGSYTVAVSAPDESDGEGAAAGDTKEVTVR